MPSQWVARFAPIVPAGRVLDLACGSGRHAILFAELGHPVLAVDRDADALDRIRHPLIQTFLFDLETGISEPGPIPFSTDRFSGIVVTNYLHRPLFGPILDCLADGGILIYETFAVGNEQFGKPTRPAFLLKHGELLSLVNQSPDLHVVAYEDGVVERLSLAAVQRICIAKAKQGFPLNTARLP